MVMALVCEMPGDSGRCWALPFFTSLCPSKRYFATYTKRGKAKKLGDWSRQMILQLSRWTQGLGRAVYVVGDGSYARFDLFAEVRRHLGVETQRQWSDLAIKRSTPILMALFSIVTIWAWKLKDHNQLIIRKTAWYDKDHITFSDALAAVRTRIYQHNQFLTSTHNTQHSKLTHDIRSLWEIIVSNIA